MCMLSSAFDASVGQDYSNDNELRELVVSALRNDAVSSGISFLNQIYPVYKCPLTSEDVRQTIEDMVFITANNYLNPARSKPYSEKFAKPLVGLFDLYFPDSTSEEVQSYRLRLQARDIETYYPDHMPA